MEQLELASLVGQWKEAVEGSQLSADALEPFLPIFARMQQVCKTLLTTPHSDTHSDIHIHTQLDTHTHPHTQLDTHGPDYHAHLVSQILIMYTKEFEIKNALVADLSNGLDQHSIKIYESLWSMEPAINRDLLDAALQVFSGFPR
ncbi:MAG: hypothetical protein SGCHY_001419 [Lobulomycetales sp.]